MGHVHHQHSATDGQKWNCKVAQCYVRSVEEKSNDDDGFVDHTLSGIMQNEKGVPWAHNRDDEPRTKLKKKMRE